MDEIRLVELNDDNIWDVLDLTVNKEQEDFVAPNFASIAEAYLVTRDGGHVYPFGIFHGETPVGFVMIGYDYLEAGGEKLGFVRNNYLLWRFMIDKQYQQKGYGKAALKLALDFIRTRPCGDAEYCWLSYEPENEVARKLYCSFGFVEQAEMPEGWDEIPAVLKL